MVAGASAYDDAVAQRRETPALQSGVRGGLAVALALLACAGCSGSASVLSSSRPGASGSFRSSDPLLNRIWSASVSTARQMVVPGPLRVDVSGRPCPIALRKVVIDGVRRDRCPYIGDLAVTGDTLLTSTPSDDGVVRAMIVWFARHQHRDGAIPASPLWNGKLVLFDYNAYWILILRDDVLYTGDLGLARSVWPNLLRLVEGWYPAQRTPSGLLRNHLGAADYAFIHRHGTLVGYFNASYALALRAAAELADWLGHPAEASRWRRQVQALVKPFNATFWDARNGAYRDTPTGPLIHPQDGNAFAILAGLATPAQATSALAYLSAHDAKSYGNTIADNDAWDFPGWGGLAGERVYPFISYYEVLARYKAGQPDSALELIEREWGYMVTHGPRQGMWETIGPFGQGPIGDSWEHGWSSGAAIALTGYVLGIRPAEPGYRSFLAEPEPSGVSWADGTVPTPHGPIEFSWKQTSSAFTAAINTPVGGTMILPVVGTKTILDGKAIEPPGLGGHTTINVSAGSHTHDRHTVARFLTNPAERLISNGGRQRSPSPVRDDDRATRPRLQPLPA